MRWPTLLVAVLLPSFVSLGQWQWAKGDRKAEAQSLRDTRGADAAISLPTHLVAAGSDTARALRFRPVSLRGHFLAERQFLLDNRVHQERAGYHVLTPFRVDGAEAVVLVNRGWIAAGASHGVTPVIETPSGPLSISGTIVLAPTRFFTLASEGNTPGWSLAARPVDSKPPVRADSPVWQTLDVVAFARQSGLPTHGIVVQLDAASPAGFVRDWPRPDERIERHYAYALQWFGFALATLGLWLWWLFRREAQ